MIQAGLAFANDCVCVPAAGDGICVHDGRFLAELDNLLASRTCLRRGRVVAQSEQAANRLLYFVQVAKEDVHVLRASSSLAPDHLEVQDSEALPACGWYPVAWQ